MEAVYRPTYAMDAAQRAETQAKIDQWTADCLATIDTSASQYAQALGVYTYLIDHADYQDVGSNSIVNIMVGGAGLCGCYAKTMQYVLNQLGIQAAYITGQAKGQSHAWNLVWLDGTPCWVDPTWGDPVFAGGEESQGPGLRLFRPDHGGSAADAHHRREHPGARSASPMMRTISIAADCTLPPITPVR